MSEIECMPILREDDSDKPFFLSYEQLRDEGFKEASPNREGIIWPIEGKLKPFATIEEVWP